MLGKLDEWQTLFQNILSSMFPFLEKRWIWEGIEAKLAIKVFCVVALPPSPIVFLNFLNLRRKKNLRNSRQHCILIWPDGEQGKSAWDFRWNIKITLRTPFNQSLKSWNIYKQDLLQNLEAFSCRYNCLIIICTYTFPLLIMAVCYSKMAR